MRRFQLFIHRHYDAIKLVLLVIIFLVAFLTIISLVQQGSREATERAAAVEKVLGADRHIIEDLKKDSAEQTETINRQFRALCVLIIETSGQEGLSKLDPDSRARCERLDGEELTSSQQESSAPKPSAAPNRPSENQSSSLPDTNSQPKSEQQPTSQPVVEPAPTEQPQAPQEPDEPKEEAEGPEEPRGVVDIVGDTVNGVINIVRGIL